MDAVPKGGWNMGASSGRVRRPDLRDTACDRLGFVRDLNPGAAPCGDWRFGEDVGDRFDLVGRRIRVDRRSGRSLGGHRRR
jgi:hypothetical protein